MLELFGEKSDIWERDLLIDFRIEFLIFLAIDSLVEFFKEELVVLSEGLENPIIVIVGKKAKEGKIDFRSVRFVFGEIKDKLLKLSFHCCIFKLLHAFVLCSRYFI